MYRQPSNFFVKMNAIDDPRDVDDSPPQIGQLTPSGTIYNQSLYRFFAPRKEMLEEIQQEIKQSTVYNKVVAQRIFTLPTWDCLYVEALDEIFSEIPDHLIHLRNQLIISLNYRIFQCQLSYSDFWCMTN
jgi:hypothetical protein